MAAFETRLLKIITRFMFLLALFSLPSISATTDCGGMPFRCVNSTFFKICVDFGNGISSTVDDFVIPCPPGTECRLTNQFECEAPPALLEKPTATEKVTTTSEKANTKYKDERSVVTPMWEKLPSVNPHEVEFSEKYLDTINHVTLIDESLSTTNAVFYVMPEVTTESMFVTIPDIIPHETTTMKNIGVTERNLKETEGDFLKPAEITTAYRGMNTEHPLVEPEIIPTSGVIYTIFSENSDVISRTEQYAVGDFSHVDGAETVTTESKVSNPNDNFVEATALSDSGINEFFYSTPAPISEKPDQTDGPNNPISPPNVLEIIVQKETTESMFVTDMIPDVIPFETTTTKKFGVTERNLKETEGDFLKPAEKTTAYRGMNTEHPLFEPEIITTSEVIYKIFSENSDVISTTEKYAVGDFSQVDGAETVTTAYKISNPNDYFVEATTLSDSGINEFFYSTPAPISEKPDQTEGSNNPISPPNILEIIVQKETTESMFVTDMIPDMIPFETTTTKKFRVTERNLKETEGDFLKPAEKTTAYRGMNTEHPLFEPKTIPTSEVIYKIFSENSDVISTTEKYAVGNFSQVDGAEAVTTESKVSEPNDNFVEASTLSDSPAPKSKKTDQIGGPNNPISPPNVLETTEQNVGTKFAFTAAANDAYKITMSLTPTDTISHNVNIVNTGVLHNNNLDFPVQGHIFESSPTTTESVTFATLATTLAKYASDSISEVKSNILEIGTEIPKDTLNPDGINFEEISSNAFENKPKEKRPSSMTDSMMTSIIPGNKNVTEESTKIKTNVPTEVQESIRPISQNNLPQQADGKSTLASQMHAVNKEENQTVNIAKATPGESAPKIHMENDKLQPTTEVNGDNIPTEANLYSRNKQRIPMTIEQTPGKRDNVAITAKDQTSLNKEDSESKITGIDLSVATDTIPNDQQGSKLDVNGIYPSSISNAEPSNIKPNTQTIEETKVYQFHSGKSQQTPDKIDKPKIQLTNVNTTTLTHVRSIPQKQQTARKTDDTETDQINQDTATVVASTAATISQVPTPITEGEVNKPTAPGVQVMITESLPKTPSDSTDFTKQLENVNGAILEQSKHLSGQSNVFGNLNSNLKQDGALDDGTNDYSQTEPSSVATSPSTKTNIGVDESLLVEVTNAYQPEEAVFTVSIPANKADTTTSQLPKGMIKPTHVTAPAMVIIENVHPKMAASTRGMVPVNAINANTGTTPGLHFISPSENIVNPPTTLSSVQLTHREVRNITTSVQASDVPVKEPNNDLKVVTIHLISKPKVLEGKPPSLTQPSVISKEEIMVETSNINTVPTVSRNVNITQQILKGNNVASLKIAGVTGVDMINTTNDQSNNTADGKTQTAINDVTDDSYMSTEPANVIPNPEPSISHRTSQSSVIEEVKVASISNAEPSNIKPITQTIEEIKVYQFHSGKPQQTPDKIDKPKIQLTNVDTTTLTHVRSIPQKQQTVRKTDETETHQINQDTATVVASTAATISQVPTPITDGEVNKPTAPGVQVMITEFLHKTPSDSTDFTKQLENVNGAILEQTKHLSRQSNVLGNNNSNVNQDGALDEGTYDFSQTEPSSVASSQLGTPSASIGFSCSNLTRGRYSDKDDCRKFHICIDRQDPIVGYCSNNTVFSEIKKQCTKNLSHCVRGNEFQCVSPGRYSDYLLKNVYYICVKNHHSFYRFKFQCQTGFYLDKTLVRCVLNIAGSVESVSLDDVSEKDSDLKRSTSTTTRANTERILRKTKKQKESKSSTSTERSRRKNRDECEEVGKYPHPEDCRKYYVCYKASRSRLRRRRKECDSDEVFHKDKRKCVDVESYECDL